MGDAGVVCHEYYIVLSDSFPRVQDIIVYGIHPKVNIPDTLCIMRRCEFHVFLF
jgi:hypothetical protein